MCSQKLQEKQRGVCVSKQHQHQVKERRKLPPWRVFSLDHLCMGHAEEVGHCSALVLPSCDLSVTSVFPGLFGLQMVNLWSYFRPHKGGT